MKPTTLTVVITGSLLAASVGLILLPQRGRSASQEAPVLPGKSPQGGRSGDSAAHGGARSITGEQGSEGSRTVKPGRVLGDLNEARKHILQACSSGNLLDRRRQLAELMEDFDEEDFLMAPDALNTLGLGPNSPECRMVLAAWVEKEPEVAMERLAKAQRGILLPLVRIWAERDPEAAMSWVENHQTSEEKSHLVGQVIGAVMKKEPAQARAMLEKLSRSEQGLALQFLMPDGLAADGPTQARAWVEAMPEGLREQAAAMLIEMLPGSRTAEKFEWLREYPGLAARGFTWQIFREWAGSDRQAAEAAAEMLEAGPEREAAYEGIYTIYLIKGDEKKAFEILERSMPEFDERKLEAWLKAIRNGPTELALEQVPRLSDEGKREAMYEYLLKEWWREDREEVKKWMDGHPIPEGVKEKVTGK